MLGAYHTDVLVLELGVFINDNGMGNLDCMCVHEKQFQEVNGSILVLTDKLDTHIEDEKKRWDSLSEKLDELKPLIEARQGLWTIFKGILSFGAIATAVVATIAMWDALKQHIKP